MIGTTQLINAFGAPVCFTDTTDIFKDGSGVALYSLDYDASDTGGASGKFGEAAMFNGSSSRIELPSISGLPSNSYNTNDFTFSCWVRSTTERLNNGGGSNPIFQNNVGSYQFIGFGGNDNGNFPNGKLFYYTYGGSASYHNNWVITSDSYADGEWHHLVVTDKYNSGTDNRTRTIYVDGVQKDQDTVDKQFANGSETTHLIGDASGSGNRHADIDLDQVRIWTSALTQTQIDQLYLENSSTVGTHLFGCVANYNFDGNAKESMGTTAYDGTETDITYRYDGTPTAVDFGVGGKSNYGARFNGSNSGIQINTFSGFTNYNFTLSIWIKTTDTVGYITSFRDPIYITFGLGIYSAGSNGMGIYDGTNSYYINNTAMQGINDGNWHHIAMTHDGINLKGYIDGSIIATVSSGTTTQHSGGTNYNRIGLRADGNTSSAYNGLVDQLRLFSKALNQTEVSQLYGNGAGEIACKYTSTTDNVAYPIANTAYYKLNNNSKDSARSTGKFNEGAVFNGSSSRIQITSNATTPLNVSSGNFSISMWVNPSNLTNNNKLIYKWGTSASLNSWIATITTNGVLYVVEGTTAGDTLMLGTTTIPTNAWTHIAITRAQGGNLVQYINGVATNTFSTQNRSLKTSTEPLYIGYQAGQSTNFTGSIDQVRIYNTTLDSTDVSNLYAETVSDTSTLSFPSGKTAIATYQLDGSSTDLSGNYSGTDTDVKYAYDGTESNIEYRFGRYGQAAMFKLNGSTSVFDTNVSVPTNWTVSLWLKRTPNGYFGGTTNSSVRSGVYFYANSNGKLSIYNRNSSGGNIDTLNTSTGLVTEGNWHHIAITFDSTSGTGLTTVYVDSANAGTLDGTPTHSTDFKFGRSGDYTSDTFNGSIDQMRIFDSALTDSQVTELYNEKPEVDTSNFKAVLYEGNGGTQYISNVGFQPDFVWIKNRDTSNNHMLYDSVRGATKTLNSNGSGSEGTHSDALTSFEDNGFFLGSKAHVNGNNNSLVAWTWKAGGDAVQNTQGTITSDVSANTEAGFSIVKYTGNGGSAAKTIGHGLSSAPEIIISKNLDNSSYDWAVYTSATGETKKLALNQSNAQATSGVWNDTSPTNSVFSVRYDQTNATGDGFIAYCWHSVAGYSKIGTYEGDGANDYSKEITGLGFDPSFVMVKNVDSSGSNWEIIDSRRGDEKNLYANEAYSENANSATSYGSGKFITDGFKVATGSVSSSVHWNKSGDTYLYMAFK